MKSSGLTTVTEDPNTGALVGLHIDDWYNAPLTSRSDAPNRVCINLGCEERSFLFLPLSIARIWDAVGNIESGVKHTSVARLFMRMVSCYPIVRLRVRPGEGYIAPTENIVHDGSSKDMSSLDVSLSLRGHFELSNCRQR